MSSPATPHLLPFFYLHKTTLPSAEGIQQGDPLGPLLFCLTIHPLIKCLKSEFRVVYLDDGTIGGAENDVLKDLQGIEHQVACLGLHLNHAKTELIAEDPAGSLLLQAAPNLCRVSPEDAFLLVSRARRSCAFLRFRGKGTSGDFLQVLVTHWNVIIPCDIITHKAGK